MYSRFHTYSPLKGKKIRAQDSDNTFIGNFKTTGELKHISVAPTSSQRSSDIKTWQNKRVHNQKCHWVIILKTQHQEEKKSKTGNFLVAFNLLKDLIRADKAKMSEIRLRHDCGVTLWWRRARQDMCKHTYLKSRRQRFIRYNLVKDFVESSKS